MLISSYNNKGLKDVLIIQLRECTIENQMIERKGNMTKIYEKESGETVGYNLFNASEILDLFENGPVTLTEEQVKILNEYIKLNNWTETLKADNSPKFVVGHVIECKPLEGSDHLNITKIEIDNDEVVQIVCGAENIKAGQKVVVAKPGSIMPDGLVIWPGELRGVKSNGMVCSAKELGLEQKSKGILVLEGSEETGRIFSI